jgi:hypothetical protein
MLDPVLVLAPAEARERGGQADIARASSLACSVGIMAYNEAANIANAITSILHQPLALGAIAEVIVVASGCTDDTVPIVAELARQEPRVRLIIQDRREGKASAINQFLAAARSPILLMASADVVIREGTIDLLLRHFQDPTVGMVGAHPVPVNDQRTFLGSAVHLVWELHDQVARVAPKLGEVVAFRNVVPSIPLDTPVDEISIQALLTQLGYRLVYEPQAIVYNRGPSTVGDFLRQRRRIYAGHLLIRQQQGYSASTMSLGVIARALAATHAFATPQAAWRTVGAIALEALSRGMGTYDYVQRRPQHIWQMATTTKGCITTVSDGAGRQSVLVFRIVDFHLREIELGARDSQQVVRAVEQRLSRQLGAGAIMSAAQSGTVVALLPLDREEAEARSRQAIEHIAATPVRLNGARREIPVALSCGVITLVQAGQRLALSVTGTPAAGQPVQAVSAVQTIQGAHATQPV